MTDFIGGWNAQRPDIRDIKYAVSRSIPLTSYYLSDTHRMPPVYDQLNLGSCVANAVGKLIHFAVLNKYNGVTLNPYLPSRLFTYYYSRLLEGTRCQDSGCAIRDAIKVVATQGAPSEDAWIYDPTKYCCVPPDNAITLGQKLRAVEYKSIDNTDKQVIISALKEGFPIAFGISVYESFMSNQVGLTGIVPLPQPSERTIGGHAMVIVGYHSEDDSFIFCNSWGLGWGQRGYGRIPSNYITNPDLASDFWIITKIA